MANSVLLWLLAATMSPPPQVELVKLSLLDKPARPFTMTVDIFNGNLAAGAAPTQENPSEAKAAQEEALQKSIAEEIAQSVVYEGYVLKESKRSALLSVSGEFFMVGEQDTVLDKIKILKITQDTVTIEYDGQLYEIMIKGEPNG